jgi:hypothetical protein
MIAQMSFEIMMGLFLAVLIALAISYMLVKSAVVYNSDMALDRLYAFQANQSVVGLESLCRCHRER